ncbi:hypothetical protein Pla110_13650 [Polystyrenella longa]|uniref:Uncharacterized protein n=1 Tax=Polystyrenella longa TaxID=2528007 RepID=A0A518CKE3_9PLAN|nr:hypothetical protein [Polystyrenella longa]QDU79654.1 hypothetical protein Pla110_13650 [Polystyrenella longa]
MAAESDIEARMRQIGDRVTTAEGVIRRLDERETNRHAVAQGTIDRHERRIDEHEVWLDGDNQYPGIKSDLSNLKSQMQKLWWMLGAFFAAMATAVVGVLVQNFTGGD